MSDEILKNDEMQEIIDEFVTESSELIENVIQDVVIIENNPDEEMVNGIFRAVHTIKGTSSFLGFNALSQLAHKAEDVMGMIRKGEMKPDQEIADVLLEAFDLMKLMIEDIRIKSPVEREANAVIEKLEALLKKDRKMIGEILVEEKVITRNERDEVLERQKQDKEKKFGEIIVEEKLITETQLNNFLSKQKTTKEEQTIRIDVKKLDELMNLVGELVLGKNRLILLDSLVKKGSEGDGILDNLADVTNYVEGITNGLQLSVMRARLVPIGKLFNKVPRQVRDLCGEFKKDIELKIEGENTELDRSLIEALHDPLIHIIRNSVDHGIEAPEERMKKGKRSKGLISIRAYNEGNHVIVEIFDDGKGINVQAVKEKVKEKGIMSDMELNNLSAKETMNLIFIPGLSTAKKVSKVSGRGVGMDVVKTNIEKMNGQAYIDSEEGQWAKLTIRLPLTLAIMRALIVKIADDLFAVPLNTVVELVKIREGLIKSVDKNEVFVLRDIVIPIVDLSKTFSANDSNGKGGYLVICNITDKIVGLKVHAVVGQEEVVIKPLGEFLKNIKGISGATIRGDGKVIPILDIPGVISNFNIQRRVANQQQTVANAAAN
ncbi:MAG: chemotaxis protein CheA [Syntrophorhabdaceae bacterium]|nr:chemotaxis protein CheA [Syntrophorhabdaceae bacterium]MDD5243364.1 chemotaxis protein CheA [Syntrophorhabdaceae bacterium]